MDVLRIPPEFITLGQALTWARKVWGLTPLELAKRINADGPWILELERDRTGVSLGRVNRLAAVLGVEPADFRDRMPHWANGAWARAQGVQDGRAGRAPQRPWLPPYRCGYEEGRSCGEE